MAESTSNADPIKYAVVGLGYIAQIAVLPAFAHARRNSRLHALISSDDDKLAALSARYHVPVRGGYADYERCLKEVDAVFICTPNTEHADFAVRAADAGVHVLCEKPLASSTDDCDRILQACQDAGVWLMTAYRLHFEPLSLEVVERVRRGDIGEPRFFSSSFAMRAIPGGIRTKRATGGGTLWDIGIYCLNAARMLFAAEPNQVFAYSVPGARSGMPEIDEMTSAVLRFDGGRLATFTTSFAAADVSSYRLVGTEGDVLVEPAYEYAEALTYALTSGGKTMHRKGKRQDQFAAELLYFSDCILQHRAPEPSGEEGARDVRIIEALYESAERGEAIALPPFLHDRQPDSRQAISQPPVRKRELVHATPPHE